MFFLEFYPIRVLFGKKSGKILEIVNLARRFPDLFLLRKDNEKKSGIIAIPILTCYNITSRKGCFLNRERYKI